MSSLFFNWFSHWDPEDVYKEILCSNAKWKWNKCYDHLAYIERLGKTNHWRIFNGKRIREGESNTTIWRHVGLSILESAFFESLLKKLVIHMGFYNHINRIEKIWLRSRLQVKSIIRKSSKNWIRRSHFHGDVLPSAQQKFLKNVSHRELSLVFRSLSIYFLRENENWSNEN